MPIVQGESFWKTTKAKIAGIVAAVALIASTVTQLDQSFSKIITFVKKYLPSKVEVEVRTKHFEKLPSSLKNSIPQKQDLLYWYYVKVDNKSPHALQLKIDYTVHSGPARGNDSFRETVEPRSSLAKYENPYLDVLTYDERRFLEITWSITDHTGGKDKELKSETATIQLLPRNVVAWDLKDPDGNRVSRDFLLASLAAWTIKQGAVKNRAHELLRGVDSNLEPDAYARSWFRECYNRVFKDSQGLKIRHGLDSFPPQSEQTIRLPGELLKGSLADPIEGALLLGALNNVVNSDVRVNVVIFVVPDAQGAPTNQLVLFSWSKTRVNDWHALNISHSSMLNFEENERGATAQLAALLQREPDILQALNATGTFLKEGRKTVALDLEKASLHFDIQGLP
jgi:hypothetical protein